LEQVEVEAAGTHCYYSLVQFQSYLSQNDFIPRLSASSLTLFHSLSLSSFFSSCFPSLVGCVRYIRLISYNGEGTLARIWFYNSFIDTRGRSASKHFVPVAGTPEKSPFPTE